MCTNYVPTSADILEGWFKDVVGDCPAESFPGYNAPFIKGGNVAFLRGNGQLVYGRFGLVPHWTKPEDVHSASRKTYNARSETVATLPSYRGPWAKGQFCVIPVQAIYEPCYETGRPVRWRIERADRGTMWLAGIWERWKGPDGVVESFSMLTVNADGHPLMQRFHAYGHEKRMVVILDEEDIHRWLGASPADAMSFMNTYPAELLTAKPEPLPPRRPRAREEPDAPPEPPPATGSLF
jgi:putative SOS response-associated peptidase YedK